MANNKKASKPCGQKATSTAIWITAAVLVAAGIGYAIYLARNSSTADAAPNTNAPLLSATAASALPSTNAPKAASTNSELPVIDINQAVMVTVELDFGPQIPSIPEALQHIERRYEPADGVGRTFAILDAYGEPTPDRKKLHMSMHVSTEKPGTGALVFRRTGEVLWKSKIVATNSSYFNRKNLLILFTDENGKGYTVDGSSNPVSILDANLKELGAPLRSVWPDGTEREFTYIYSACGCPVKVKVRRVGDKTARSSDLPVMFPDDPAAVDVISTLMRWR